MEARLQILRKILETYQNGSTETALAMVKHGRSKELMDKVRYEIGQFEKKEFAWLKQHNAQLEKGMHYLSLGVAFCALLTVALAGGAVYFVHALNKDMQRKAAFQSGLLNTVDAAIFSTSRA